MNLNSFSPLRALALVLLLAIAVPSAFAGGRRGAAVPADGGGTVFEKGSIKFSYNDRGISGLTSKDDPFNAPVTPPGQPLTLSIRYQVKDGEWLNMNANGFQLEASPDKGLLKYTLSGSNSPISVVQTFTCDGNTIDWDIDVTATAPDITIGDFSISVPNVGPRGENPKQIFENGFTQHKFISGYGSFMYYVRANGVGPYLMVTVQPGTKLEYSGGGGGRGGGGGSFVHSGKAGNDEKRGTWRQEHTFLKLGAPGSSTAKVHYGFRLQWAKSYEDMREVLYKNGLFDIRSAPGMTIPNDLTATVALHTKAKIESVTAEFPTQTKIAERRGAPSGFHIYDVSFQKLGENMLTINHDGGRKTYLEYFVSEPLETLIKKRASFIINRQMIRDTNKWWDGVFGPYDMKAKVVRTVDDPDIFLGRMIYSLTCDDPGLSKAPYVAEKNVSFPDQKEIEGLEYHLEHFVWGKLQRTDKETPYPYGVYGTPNWYIDRDPELRRKWVLGGSLNANQAGVLAAGAAVTEPQPNQTNTTAYRDLKKEHVWRSYDYPHIVMMYYHMYEIAKKYPQMSKYLDAKGYLERTFQTARAFYIYPYEIYPEYYESTKWGLYNELVVLKLADALDREGMPDKAAWLRAEWEKKTKYFVYDDPYPFRSEYAFDRTAFESTYALAKYGATHDMKPDTNLWHDIKNDKWYSHPSVKKEDSRAFMERQLYAGLCVRGWLNTAYYTLGSDPGVSYMAAMGGWGVLDYAENFADKPYDWLGLGYASYLSSWCLVNSGPAENNYGVWFPGKENDGAAGWQFTSSKVGNAWMGSSYPGGVSVPRGPWHYDGEIDLGYCGALRMSATIITHDPVFDWIAYGGNLSTKSDSLSVVPRDGLRQRFAAIVGDPKDSKAPINRLKLELDRDGFASGENIVMDKSMNKISFTMENRTKDSHSTGLWLSVPAGSEYEVTQDGQKVALTKTGVWDYPQMAQLKIGTAPAKIEITRVRRR